MMKQPLDIRPLLTEKLVTAIDDYLNSEDIHARQLALTHYLESLFGVFIIEFQFTGRALEPLRAVAVIMRDLADGAAPALASPSRQKPGSRPRSILDREFPVEAASLIDFLKDECGSIDAAAQQVMKLLGEQGFVSKTAWQHEDEKNKLKDFRKRLSKGTLREDGTGEIWRELYLWQTRFANPADPSHDSCKNLLFQTLNYKAVPLKSGR